MPAYYFAVYRDDAGEWRWYLWSHDNRRTLADSGEGFSSEAACKRNIDLVRTVAPSAPTRQAQ